MGVAWDTYGQIFSNMGITEVQFISAVKNRKSQIVPLVQNQQEAITNKSKGVSIVNSILDNVGASNAGGYAVIAMLNGVPESHVNSIEVSFIDLVVAMHENGDLE